MAWSELLPEAEDEYLDAVTYYERRQPGLGARLRTELLGTLDRIRSTPRIYRVTHEPGFRQAPLGRFPYSIVYQETADGILVIAVAHDRQRLGYWLDRI